MSKVMIIGAGGVSNVVVHKCAEASNFFTDILLASRTLSKCDSIAKNVYDKFNVKVKTAKLDADNTDEIVKLIENFNPEIVVNVALPYQDLTIMDACLKTKVHYLDTANYEPKDEAKFEYSWQWAYDEKFKSAGICAVLGCGFDPGVTGVFTAYAKKHYFDEIHYLDIVDCNAGDHGKYFATNFNPEINIREITQKGKYYENGKWIETEPLTVHKPIDYPGIGERESYLLYHEELESIVKNFPEIKRARFWMTFGEKYLTALTVLQEVGMTSIKPIVYEGKEIIPLQFLKAVLPEPASLGENYKGETSIGCKIKGIKNGSEKSYYIWNNCRHEKVYNEIKAQAVAYTTGVPAMIGAMMVLTGKWNKPGVFNVEQFDPDYFMEMLNKYGLPWNEKIN